MVEQHSSPHFLGNTTTASGIELAGASKVVRIPTTTAIPWVESSLKIKGAGAGRLEFHLPYIAQALETASNRPIKHGETTAGAEIAANINDLLHLQPGNVLVDLGMGPGIIAKHMSKHLGEAGWLYCVDASPSMLESAHSVLLGENATLIHGDIHTVDKLIPEKADAAILSGNVHLLSNRRLAFRSIFNMLKPDGKLVLVTHLNKNARKETTKFAAEIDRLEETRPDLQVGGLRLPMLTEKELKDILRLLRSTGFTVQQRAAETDAPDVNEVLGQGNIPVHGVSKRLQIMRRNVGQSVVEDMSHDVLMSLYEGSQMQVYILCTKQDPGLLPMQK